MNASSQFKNLKRRFCARALVCCCLFTAGSDAVGQTSWPANPAIVGDWATASNWTLGVPNASSGTAFDARIDNGGTAQLSLAGASVRRMRVGTSAGGGGLAAGARDLRERSRPTRSPLMPNLPYC
jgi:hypothetical protein